jgi:peroxiredoxin
MAVNKVKLVVLVCLAVMFAITGCKKKPQSRQDGTEPNNPDNPAQNKTVQTADSSKPSLNDIIKRARGWAPAYFKWVGKEAPDFTVTDITGKTHRLSDYRGKTVMLIFWATWCRPCIMEIPHLIELRKTIGEDKLAMLAISFIDFRNSPETVKRLVAANPDINYTITATDRDTLPRPYNYIDSIPSSFFIAPDGRIKIATEGLIGLRDTKAIIEAER